MYQTKLRVYYEHTDAGGIVYHSNYLNFMERCRCDWLDELGFDVVTTEQQFGMLWVVREANLVYHAPARLFDELVIDCAVLQVGKVKLLLQQNVYNKDQLICSGVIKLATLNSTSFKLSAMPSALITAFGNRSARAD
jgi:acyl-CoA thioester hydrolase